MSPVLAEQQLRATVAVRRHCQNPISVAVRFHVGEYRRIVGTSGITGLSEGDAIARAEKVREALEFLGLPVEVVET